MKTISNNTRRSLGIPGAVAIVLEPGGTVEVSESRYDEMRNNRMVNQWFQRGMLSEGGKAPERAKKSAPEAVSPAQKRSARSDRPAEPLPDGVDEVGVHLYHVGGGYYHVYVNGFKVTTDKVRGKANAEEVAAEYENPEE
jgi:hypothetical protein